MQHPEAALPIALSILAGPHVGQRFPISRCAIEIGRSPSCDIVLHDRFVSGRHCTLEFGKPSWRVTDHGSTNGTFAQGAKVTASAQFQLGDALVLGESTIATVVAWSERSADESSSVLAMIADARATGRPHHLLVIRIDKVAHVVARCRTDELREIKATTGRLVRSYFPDDAVVAGVGLDHWFVLVSCALDEARVQATALVNGLAAISLPLSNGACRFTVSIAILPVAPTHAALGNGPLFFYTVCSTAYDATFGGRQQVIPIAAFSRSPA